jgi:hypothetical protein
LGDRKGFEEFSMAAHLARLDRFALPQSTTFGVFSLFICVAFRFGIVSGLPAGVRSKPASSRSWAMLRPSSLDPADACESRAHGQPSRRLATCSSIAVAHAVLGSASVASTRIGPPGCPVIACNLCARVRPIACRLIRKRSRHRRLAFQHSTAALHRESSCVLQ